MQLDSLPQYILDFHLIKKRPPEKHQPTKLSFDRTELTDRHWNNGFPYCVVEEYDSSQLLCFLGPFAVRYESSTLCLDRTAIFLNVCLQG